MTDCLRDHALNGPQMSQENPYLGANSLQMFLEMVNADLGVTLISDMAEKAGNLQRTRVGIRILPINRYYL